MTYRQVEIITGTGRRRRISAEQKIRILEQAFAPGVNASEVARRHEVHVSLLFRWRRQYLRGELGAPRGTAAFVPVQVSAAPQASPAACEPPGLIEIVLPGGPVVRVDRHVDAEALRRVLGVLEGR
jgi:transposase